MTLADLATLRGMSTVDLWALAAEIRGFLVDNIRAEILRAHGLDASGITATVLKRLKAA
jgi:hypothetical protein